MFDTVAARGYGLVMTPLDNLLRFCLANRQYRSSKLRSDLYLKISGTFGRVFLRSEDL